ncbi:hypothetical protein M513_11995 [Trichuris suis]|nr:hypothetical protein M513_11995 [Trichuris suis]
MVRKYICAWKNKARFTERCRRSIATSISPAVWSMYDWVQEGLPRTQNSTEPWHRRWKSVISANHAEVHHILEELRKEHRRVEIDPNATSGARQVLAEQDRFSGVIRDSKIL